MGLGLSPLRVDILKSYHCILNSLLLSFTTWGSDLILMNEQWRVAFTYQ